MNNASSLSIFFLPFFSIEQDLQIYDGRREIKSHPWSSDQWSRVFSFPGHVISSVLCRINNATKSFACGQLIINKKLFDASLHRERMHKIVLDKGELGNES